MATIEDLLEQVENPELKIRLRREVKKIKGRKKFGLVFEEHLPECTPLYDVPVAVGKNVSLKNGVINDIYTVAKIDGDKVICLKKGQDELFEFGINDVVVTATFGEPIYPYLKPIDSVCNAPNSDLWHTLIEADNYHALQLLEYMYHGKVDCIYIDPPYNTGARDWKYNNNYVDSNDVYRHSKWLSFMKKRLELAKKLLNPEDSVLIVTIDEKEYLHLGCLLEEMFPESRIQMISSMINFAGSTRNAEFARSNEYIFILYFGNAMPFPVKMLDNGTSGRNSNRVKTNYWKQLRKTSDASRRIDRPNLFYPIYVDMGKKRIIKIGDPIDISANKEDVPNIDGLETIWPIRKDGSEGRWYCEPSTLREYLSKHYVKVGNNGSISYLTEKYRSGIENGTFTILGYSMGDGEILFEIPEDNVSLPANQWAFLLHNAGTYGTNIIQQILTSKKFDYPKSLYAVHDCLNFFVNNKPNALILDFFGGSGTTLHSVNLLNAEDDGHRRCIIVTNNDVSENESNVLTEAGYQPGDENWEKLGIARYVTWPRTKCSILGIDVDGNPLNGDYFTSITKKLESERNIKQIAMNANVLDKNARKSILALIGKENLPQNLLKNDSHYIISEKHSTSIIFDLDFVDDYIEELGENDHITDIYIVTEKNAAFKQIKQEINDVLGPITKDEVVKMPMAEGFKANCAYFKLGFLEKAAVEIGRQLKELLPVLWMKAGAVGPCPEIMGNTLPDMLVLPENRFAVLIDDTRFAAFKEQVEQHAEIDYVYIVTDSDHGYRNKINDLNVKNTYQLYRDYLENFKINSRR